MKQFARAVYLGLSDNAASLTSRITNSTVKFHIVPNPIGKLLSLLAHGRLPRDFCKRAMLGAHGHWAVKLLRCTWRVLAWLHNTHQFTISDIIFSMILMITLLYIFSRICLYFYKDTNQNNSAVVSSFSSAGSISHQRAFFAVPQWCLWYAPSGERLPRAQSSSGNETK